MLNRFLISGGFAVLLIVGIQNPAQAQELVIEGSRTFAVTLLLPNERDVEAQSSQEIRISQSGSTHGIEALLEGHADMAMISAPLGTVVGAINEHAHGGTEDVKINGRELVAHEMGQSMVSFVVNPTNPVQALSQDQLYDILAGRITNWSEVGGVVMPIQILALHAGNGARAVVENKLSEWGDHLETHTFLQLEPMVVRGVAQVPGALGVVSSAHVDSSVVALATDVRLSQPLFLVTRGQPDARMQEIIQAVRMISARPGNS